MKNFKNLLPHLGATIVFIIITLVYFGPLLQGKRIKQADVLHYQGMSKEIKDYREKTGEEALWTNSMFSGMPAYQISVEYPKNLIQQINKKLKKITPHPSGIIFLCMIGFYFMLICFNVGPLLAAVGAIAFGLSSYLLIIIEAGHNPKGYAISYMAPVVAGIIITYRGRFLIGASITALALSFQIESNHLQITYYLLILLVLLGAVELYTAIIQKQLKRFSIATVCLIFAAVIGVLPNLTNLLLTNEYGQHSTRGKSDLTMDAQHKTSGLDKDYATQWSYGVGETFTLMIPNFNGGASGVIGNENKSALKDVDPQFRQYIANVDQYWGDQPFTSGPVYAGAIILFLFMLGLFIIKGEIKWWLLLATILSIMLAWGKNFMGMTDFFMDYLPGYNKFRAVSMTLVIAQFTIPLLGILALKHIIEFPAILKEKRKSFYVAFGLTGGLCLLFYLMPGTFMDFYKANEYNETVAQLKEAKLDDQQVSVFMSGIETARESIFKADCLRSFFFILIAAALVLAYATNKMKSSYLVTILGVLILIDLWAVDKRYLNKEDFVAKQKMEGYTPTEANLDILQDKDPNFRVMNFAVSPFNDASTSFFHKSIGGYHGAKLKRYQELFDYHLSKQNMKVYNMLNTKYFIVSDKDKNPRPQLNPDALGNAWFVNEYKIVANADSEILALNNFNPSQTVIVDAKFSDYLQNFKAKADSGATIKLNTYEPNHLTYASNSSSENFAVFSEIFYDKGWNAYIDGNLQPHIRVNYVLRGMKIPAGKHNIEFKFEPKMYSTGQTIALITSITLLLFVVGAVVYEVRRRNRELAINQVAA